MFCPPNPPGKFLYFQVLQSHKNNWPPKVIHKDQLKSNKITTINSSRKGDWFNDVQFVENWLDPKNKFYFNIPLIRLAYFLAV